MTSGEFVVTHMAPWFGCAEAATVNEPLPSAEPVEPGLPSTDILLPEPSLSEGQAKVEQALRRGYIKSVATALGLGLLATGCLPTGDAQPTTVDPFAIT